LTEKIRKRILTIIRNPWTISIVGGVIVFIISSVINSFVKDINIFEGLKNVAQFILNIFISILIFQIPVWVILLSIALIIIICLLVVKVTGEKPVEWLQYKNDNFFNWMFSWDYEKYGNTYKIKNIKPICATCKCDLSSDYGFYKNKNSDYLYCPNCTTKYNMIEHNTLTDVEKVIITRIKSSNYHSKSN
jgi:hypothetical protein